MANLTTNDRNKNRIALDAMYVQYEAHQETLEIGSGAYWKMQDIKAAIAELMEII